MIAVVIPAHDEEASLARCLACVRDAAAHPGLGGEPVTIVVVLDDCSDGSRAIALAHGATIVELCRRNVGAARAAGAARALEQGARWLAFTDADSWVDAAWLRDQLRVRRHQACDAVCGTVTVQDWSSRGGDAPLLRAYLARHYRDDDGHRHVHGANLGLSAQAYRRAGGFPALAVSEDVALVRALQRSGARIAWSARPRVVTSARAGSRSDARTPR